MGFFTWTLANRKTIINKNGDFSSRSKLAYYGQGCIICPDDSVITEPCYEGYGIFDGHDVYELVVDWNKNYLMEILTKKQCTKRIYFDLAEAYQKHGPEAAKTVIANAVKEGTAPPYMLKNWKRSLGIEIACTNNEFLPYPIKITDTPNPRTKKDIQRNASQHFMPVKQLPMKHNSKKPAHIDHYLIIDGSPCANCCFRKENYGTTPPQNCIDCGWQPKRGEPYFSLLPVWKEDYHPTQTENKSAFKHILQLEQLAEKDLPDYCIRQKDIEP